VIRVGCTGTIRVIDHKVRIAVDGGDRHRRLRGGRRRRRHAWRRRGRRRQRQVQHAHATGRQPDVRRWPGGERRGERRQCAPLGRPRQRRVRWLREHRAPTGQGVTCWVWGSRVRAH